MNCGHGFSNQISFRERAKVSGVGSERGNKTIIPRRRNTRINPRIHEQELCVKAIRKHEAIKTFMKINGKGLSQQTSQIKTQGFFGANANCSKTKPQRPRAPQARGAQHTVEGRGKTARQQKTTRQEERQETNENWKKQKRSVKPPRRNETMQKYLRYNEAAKK